MTAIGAIIGLILSIILIIKKVSPAYSLIAGALIGGLLGGETLVNTISIMIDGIKDISPAVVRIMTAGILTGILIKTGAAESISNAIIKALGEKRVYLALALATMLLCASGVFVDVAIITVAPIALSIGQKMGISPVALLLVMVGGGKCGNIISPNPNTIVAAENFGASMSTVIFYNLLPAILGLLFTVFVVVKIIPKSSVLIDRPDITESDKTDLPSVWSSLMAPIVVMALLACRPVFGFVIDPLIALPVGGIVGITCMRKWNIFLPSIDFGLQKMSGVAMLLIGTGTIAGIIKNSSLKDCILEMVKQMHISDTLIAPISAGLMSAATASTTAAATITSASFSDTIIAVGVSAAWGAAMVNSGSTILDQLPHGSFFHATGGVCGLSFKKRLSLIPYEALIGAFLTLMTTLMYFICR